MQAGDPGLSRLEPARAERAATCLVPQDQRAYAPCGRRQSIGEDAMVQYLQLMMRKEPITLAVMILMIAILIFGLWDILHVVKR